MSKRIYFDNAASAPLDRDVIKLLHHLDRAQGNPQGMNGEALCSYHKIQWARFQVACALNCDEDEVFFCSGATEANRIAQKIWHIKSDNKVHDSLVSRARKSDVWAVSYVNNETGHSDYADGEYRLKSRVFLDLTATIGHYPIDLSKMNNVVGASFSGHKFGGLQGCGVLYIRKDEQANVDKKILSPGGAILGGGTPNTLGIYSLGMAIKNACNPDALKKRSDKIEKMVLHIDEAANRLGLQTRCHGHIINITFRNLGAMSAVGIFASYKVDVSAGSACHSDTDRPSTVLLENGYSEDEALRTVRVSLSYQNTNLEVRKFIKILAKIVDGYDRI